MIDVSAFASDWIDELDEFLMSDHAPDDCLQLSDLDGFLTWVAIGPELIMPSEWIPTIWQGGLPDFKNTEQAARISGIIRSRYNEIIHQLDKTTYTEGFLVSLLIVVANLSLAKHDSTVANSISHGVSIRQSETRFWRASQLLGT